MPHDFCGSVLKIYANEGKNVKIKKYSKLRVICKESCKVKMSRLQWFQGESHSKNIWIWIKLVFKLQLMFS